jgi:hypothetical protein
VKGGESKGEDEKQGGGAKENESGRLDKRLDRKCSEKGAVGRGKKQKEHREVAKVRTEQCEKKGDQTLFELDFMDICRLDTPLVKRIPNSQRSVFSTVWGQLLKQALDDKKYSSWAEFNAFPKLILSTLERGGSRLSKKAKFADVVQKRLAQWKRGEKSELWKVVVARSKQDPLATPRKAKKLDIKVLEAAVVSALRMGDVCKALQMLNSAPIAPKTEATLRCLRDLHPKGPIPAPIQTDGAPHFTDDVVRAALSSFGPGSAAGLFGYKPALLQQAARAETFNFGSQLARCVNQFASGSAPEFLILHRWRRLDRT